jgi:hypothetical protein
MIPNKMTYQGRTYYFSVVLKEKNSDFMMNIYYMTVKVLGDPVDPTELQTPNRTSVSMSAITQVDYRSQGQVQFTMAVKPWIFAAENKTLFWKVFNVYVINTVKDVESIIDIEFGQVDNATFNYTVQFQNPYMYGLLNKKSDNLVFYPLNTSDDILMDLLLFNSTNQSLSINDNNETCRTRINMQFDFRGKYPQTL